MLHLLHFIIAVACRYKRTLTRSHHSHSLKYLLNAKIIFMLLLFSLEFPIR